MLMFVVIVLALGYNYTYAERIDFNGMDCRDGDGDGVESCGDNCPDVENPLQEDVDDNGIGDACDPTTIYGYITGEGVDGVAVTVSKDGVEIASILTGGDGYYAVGGLESGGEYYVLPLKADYRFDPTDALVVLP